MGQEILEGMSKRIFLSSFGYVAVHIKKGGQCLSGCTNFSLGKIKLCIKNYHCGHKFVIKKCLGIDA